MSDQDNGFRFIPATADQPPVTAVPAPSVEPVAAVPTRKAAQPAVKAAKRTPKASGKYSKPFAW